MSDIERTRAVVDAGETYDGTIMPAEQAELDRPVRIRENATVQGSVYGESVEIDDGATVEGSVMAGESVELAGHVHGEVGTPGRVVAEDGRVDGTITGTRVRLQETVVRGNVVGSEAILEESVVLGIASADRKLTVEESLCYTLRSETEAELDGAVCVLPQAIVDGELELHSPVRVAGLGRIEIDQDDEDGAAERLPEMTLADRHDHEGTSYLTLAPRVLNLGEAADRLDELEEAVLAVVNDAGSVGAADLTVEDVLDLLDVDTAAVPGGDGDRAAGD